MPNYEFYAQMIKGREQYYVDAYSAAYRDLMNVYKSEVAVQKMLYDQLTIDKENNQALLKLIANPPSDVALEEFQELVKLQEKYDDLKLRASISSTKNKLQAQRLVEDSYEIPSAARLQLDNIVTTSTQNAGTGKLMAMGPSQKGQLQAAIAAIPDTRGKKEALSIYLPLLDEIYQGESLQTLAAYSGEEYISGTELEELKAQEIKNMQKKVAVGAGSAARSTARQIKNLVNTKYSEYLTILEEGDEGIKILEKRLVDTPDVQTLSELPQFKAIAPPQEKDILRRAAEYYEPYGSDEFKEGVAEIEANKQAQAQAKENLMSQLPSYAARAFEVAPTVFETIDKSDEELNVGLPQTFAFKQLESPTYNVEDAIAAIDIEFDDPKDQQAALAILMRDRMKKHRQAKKTDLNEILD